MTATYEDYHCSSSPCTANANQRKVSRHQRYPADERHNISTQARRLPMPVALTLCDRSPELVQAWRRYFPAESGVKIVNQNILTLDVTALAVPANAFGFTD